MGRIFLFTMSTVALLIWIAGLPAGAQQEPAEARVTAAAPEGGSQLSEEERRELTQSAGKDLRSWQEVMRAWQEVHPVPKSSIIRIDERYCYPHVYASYKMEIVREDEETVWVRGLPPEDPNSPFHKLWRNRIKRGSHKPE